MSLALTELWTARAIALAVLLQTIELLQMRSVLRDDGVWQWAILRPEHQALPSPLRWLFGVILPYRPFIALLVLRLPCAFWLWAGNSFVAPLLLGIELAVCVRFRGTFNGGSDYMTVLILLALSVAWAAGSVPIAVAACFVYVAVQLVLSYFIAGISKLKGRDWRDGSALRAFVREPRYAAPEWVRALLSRKPLALALSWLVVVFECTFPVSLMSSKATLVFLVVGLLFHLGNSLVFGLNRFLFAWAAAYPALMFTSALWR